MGVDLRSRTSCSGGTSICSVSAARRVDRQLFSLTCFFRPYAKADCSCMFP
jgi:hypothetical protein